MQSSSGRHHRQRYTPHTFNNDDDDGEETRGAGAKAVDKVSELVRVTKQINMDCNEKVMFRSKREYGSRYVAAV